MDNPLEKISAWYNKQAPEVQNYIAFMTLIFIPDVSDDVLFTQGLPEILSAWFRSEGISDRKCIGKAILFRELMNLIVASSRFNKPSWDKAKNLNLTIAAQIEQEGNPRFADNIRDEVERFPLRAERWVKVGKSWNELCDNELSNDSLLHYVL